MEKIRRLKDWAQLLKQTRTFFDELGFVEVSTDQIVPAGAFEGCLDPIRVKLSQGEAELHTSPEIEMKRLLASCPIAIYEICKCFRDDPPSPIHRKEFTMLEFYQPHATYQDMQTLMKAFLTALAGEKLTFEEMSVAEAVKKHTGIDIDEKNSTQALRQAILDRDLISISEDDTWEDLYFKLLIEKVEPNLSQAPDRPTLLRDYPESQAALAALNPTTGFAERFEIYWKGVELCNGATELADVEELNRRFKRESESLKARGKPAHPYPHRLAEPMRRVPPLAGVAVGMDRLFLCLKGYPIDFGI